MAHYCHDTTPALAMHKSRDSHNGLKFGEYDAQTYDATKARSARINVRVIVSISIVEISKLPSHDTIFRWLRPNPMPKQFPSGLAPPYLQ
jgi:hypothetical protein